MRLEYKEIIYKTRSVQILRALDLDTNTIVCCKQYTITSNHETKSFDNEISFLYRLNSHPNVMKILGHTRSIQNDQNVLEMVLEYCSKGDLCAELNHRANTLTPWTDKEIQAIITTLISTFEFFQKEGIAHRDIKPDNILLTSSDELKISDLGASSSLNSMKGMQTIVGTSCYMSPELRKGFYSPDSVTSCGKYIPYDSFKSDVWSLGLTLLTVIFLRSVEDFTDLGNVENTARKRISEIKNPRFRRIMEKMLVMEPERRMDFLQLAQEWKRVIEETERCVVCGGSEGDTVWCENCSSFMHVTCVCRGEEYRCPRCNFNRPSASKMFRCCKCNRETCVQKVKTCNHLYCAECMVFNVKCKECFGIPVVKGLAESYWGVYSKICCRRCNRPMESEESGVVCRDCNLMVCAICKNSKHTGSCCQNLCGYDIYCRCKLWVHKPDIGLFVYCDLCKYVCVVCYKKPEASHLNCSELLQLNG